MCHSCRGFGPWSAGSIDSGPAMQPSMVVEGCAELSCHCLVARYREKGRGGQGGVPRSTPKTRSLQRALCYGSHHLPVSLRYDTPTGQPIRGAEPSNPSAFPGHLRTCCPEDQATTREPLGATPDPKPDSGVVAPSVCTALGHPRTVCAQVTCFVICSGFGVHLSPCFFSHSSSPTGLGGPPPTRRPHAV